MDQVERHGDLAVHLLAALSRSKVPIDRNGISETRSVTMHRRLPVMDVADWSVDGIAAAGGSTRPRLRWLE